MDVSAYVVEHIRRCVRGIPNAKAYRLQFPPGWDQGGDTFILRVKLPDGAVADIKTEAEGRALLRDLEPMLWSVRP